MSKMSRTIRSAKGSILSREVIMQLKDFKPRVIPGVQLSHFSTIPDETKKQTSHALLVYRGA